MPELKKMEAKQLEAAHKTYCDSLTHPNETRSAYFHLDILELFVKKAREILDQTDKPEVSKIIGMYFMRDGLGCSESLYEKVDNDLLQINIALFVRDGEDIYTIGPGGESTGLCPKNCGKI